MSQGGERGNGAIATDLDARATSPVHQIHHPAMPNRAPRSSLHAQRMTRARQQLRPRSIKGRQPLVSDPPALRSHGGRSPSPPRSSLRVSVNASAEIRSRLGPNDPAFFDLDASEPVPMSAVTIAADGLEVMGKAGTPPQFVYAYKRTEAAPDRRDARTLAARSRQRV